MISILRRAESSPSPGRGPESASWPLSASPRSRGVAIGGRRVNRLAETKSMIEDIDGACLAHKLDVTDGGSVERFFDAAEANLGTVAAIINNAATDRYRPLDDFTPEDIALEVSTKLTGSLLMAAHGIRGMRHAGVGGDVVFITSAAAMWPWIEHLPYAAANAGAEHTGQDPEARARRQRHPGRRATSRRDARH